MSHKKNLLLNQLNHPLPAWFVMEPWLPGQLCSYQSSLGGLHGEEPRATVLVKLMDAGCRCFLGLGPRTVDKCETKMDDSGQRLHKWLRMIWSITLFIQSETYRYMIKKKKIGDVFCLGLSCFFKMLQVNVALPSGHATCLSLPESSKVGDLKVLAQNYFQQRCLRLVTATGRILTDAEPLEAALEGGDVTAIVARAQLAANQSAFARWCPGENGVLTWGHPSRGGDSSAVQSQLRSVQQLQATRQAFAAILEDGSVVTWGDPDSGGDSSAVQDQLKSVQQIQVTNKACAAILQDGSCVTWGSPYHGGDSSAVQHKLRNVQQIQATWEAFAAVLDDGSVLTWGAPDCGGDSFADGVQDELRSVQQIQATHWAFAAILEDGSVVTWGDPRHGGDSSAVQDQLRNVQQIQATSEAFAAIVEDDSVVAWWWHGAVHSMVVTPLLSKTNWGMYSRFKPQFVRSLPFWKMVLWWRGAIQMVVVTALRSKTS